MRSMTPEEIRTFLSAGTRTGKVAWVGKDGRPHVAPIWFLLDGDDVVFNTGSDSAKGRALRRDSRISLVVDEEAAPYSFVKIDGSATTTADLDEVRRWATRIGGRYMGEDRAEEYGARNGVDGELVVRLAPTKITAITQVSD
jgi:PPOX class probable F420-dependent enzyme